MTKKFHPRIYQGIGRNFMLENRRCQILASPGTGKTSMSYEGFATLKFFGEARHALVFAPKRVALNTWVDERAKWIESFGHLSVGAAIGTEKQRIEVLKRKPDIVTINYENIDWLIEVLGDQWYFDMVFADESTRLKGLRIAQLTSKTGKEFQRGQGSLRAKKLAKVAHSRVRRWVNLTGSPCPNGLQDQWGQMWFVDSGSRLGSSFTAFENRWFRKRPMSDGYGTAIDPMPFAAEQIQAAVRDVSLTIDARDYFDIREPIEHIIRVPLPAKARRAYIDMEKRLFADIEGNPVEVFNAAGKSTKCLQIGNGAVFVDDQRNWEEVHDEKIEALRSIVEETNGAPLLIRYVYQPDRERILKAFPQFKFLDNNPQTVKDFQAGRVAGLVTHAASAGHGLSLQDNCWILVDFTTDHNLEHDEQIIERIGPTRQAQSGYKRAVFRYRLIAEDTIEENVCLPVIKRKAGVQEAFKAAMKRRG
jgi:SNF2 family DNA or RNA helicase